MKVWVAFDVGCIECGENSQLIGVFRTRKNAESVSKKAESKQAKHWCGEHKFYVLSGELRP